MVARHGIFSSLFRSDKMLFVSLVSVIPSRNCGALKGEHGKYSAYTLIAVYVDLTVVVTVAVVKLVFLFMQIFSKTERYGNLTDKQFIRTGPYRRRVKAKLDEGFDSDEQKILAGQVPTATMDEAGVTTCTCGRTYSKRKNYIRY